jgi:hypothetical protein
MFIPSPGDKSQTALDLIIDVTDMIFSHGCSFTGKKSNLKENSVMFYKTESGMLLIRVMLSVGVFSATVVLIRRGVVGRQISEGIPEVYFMTSAHKQTPSFTDPQLMDAFYI